MTGEAAESRGKHCPPHGRGQENRGGGEGEGVRVGFSMLLE